MVPLVVGRGVALVPYDVLAVKYGVDMRLLVPVTELDGTALLGAILHVSLTCCGAID